MYASKTFTIDWENVYFLNFLCRVCVNTRVFVSTLLRGLTYILNSHTQITRLGTTERRSYKYLFLEEIKPVTAQQPFVQPTATAV